MLHAASGRQSNVMQYGPAPNLLHVDCCASMYLVGSENRLVNLHLRRACDLQLAQQLAIRGQQA